MNTTRRGGGGERGLNVNGNLSHFLVFNVNLDHFLAFSGNGDPLNGVGVNLNVFTPPHLNGNEAYFINVIV